MVEKDAESAGNMFTAVTEGARNGFQTDGLGEMRFDIGEDLADQVHIFGGVGGDEAVVFEDHTEDRIDVSFEQKYAGRIPHFVTDADQIFAKFAVFDEVAFQFSLVFEFDVVVEVIKGNDDQTVFRLAEQVAIGMQIKTVGNDDGVAFQNSGMVVDFYFKFPRTQNKNFDLKMKMSGKIPCHVVFDEALFLYISDFLVKPIHSVIISKNEIYFKEFNIYNGKIR